jgi:hypothetical protein
MIYKLHASVCFHPLFARKADVLRNVDSRPRPDQRFNAEAPTYADGGTDVVRELRIIGTIPGARSIVPPQPAADKSVRATQLTSRSGNKRVTAGLSPIGESNPQPEDCSAKRSIPNQSPLTEALY